jgi:cephalosporin hydroxylase
VKIVVDTDARKLSVVEPGGERDLSLDSEEAFALLSRAWVTTGWSLKYTYGFTWMGRPIIQLPEDLLVIQEVLYRVQPDVVVETGVAHGGSLVFYASLFEAMGRGHVVGVDIEIRPHNRKAIEAHELKPRITLIEGSSTDPATVEAVRGAIGAAGRVLVILDSNHSRDHVRQELDAYADLVSVDSYLVATDGVMEWLPGLPGVPDSWADDNPKAAVEAWLPEHPEFRLEDPPPFTFNEGRVTERITHWPSAYLRRVT